MRRGKGEIIRNDVRLEFMQWMQSLEILTRDTLIILNDRKKIKIIESSLTNSTGMLFVAVTDHHHVRQRKRSEERIKQQHEKVTSFNHEIKVTCGTEKDLTGASH